MIDLASDGTISSARIADLLAPTLGSEKAGELVAAAQGRLGIAQITLAFDQALAVLDELGRTPGMVGISARFARSRFEALRAQPRASAVPPAPASVRAPPSIRRGGGPSVSADEIAALLTSAVGADKAQEIVLAAMRRLRLTRDRFDRVQALALLDHLAAEPGVVGLCARFGKARLILRFAA